MRRTPRVELAACTRRGDPTGPSLGGQARLLAGAEAETMRAEFRRLWRRQYGPAYYLMALVERLRGVDRCVIEVTPA